MVKAAEINNSSEFNNKAALFNDNVTYLKNKTIPDTMAKLEQECRENCIQNAKNRFRNLPSSTNKGGTDGYPPMFVRDASTLIRWAQNMEAALTLLSDEQTDFVVDVAVTCSVYVRYDQLGHPDKKNSPWVNPHIHVGGDVKATGEVKTKSHILVRRGYLPKLPIPIYLGRTEQ